MAKAVWTQDQIDSLNAYQIAGVMHPYTCGKCRATLKATVDGWQCPKCDYTQEGAHDFMKDWSWTSGDFLKRDKTFWLPYLNVWEESGAKQLEVK